MEFLYRNGSIQFLCNQDAIEIGKGSDLCNQVINFLIKNSLPQTNNSRAAMEKAQLKKRHSL